MRANKKMCWLILLGLVVSTFVSLDAAAQTEDERLIEGAKKEGKVVFYGSMSTSESIVLIRAFEKKYPFLKVNHYRAGSDTLLEKILIETRSGVYNADVYNLRSFTAHVMMEKGLFGQYVSPQSKAIPAGFKDPGGRWASFYMNPATIGYNTSLVSSAEAPKDWSDLLLPKWKGQMVMDREESEWFANMLKVMGREKGLDFMKKLARQDIIYRVGHTLLAQLVAAGEFKLAVVIYSPRIEVMRSSGAPIDWVRANPVVAYHYVAALSSRPPNPNAARLFLDYVLSKEGQEVLVSTGRVPIRTDVKPNPPHLVEGVNLVPSDIDLAKDFKKHYDEYRAVFGVN